MSAATNFDVATIEGTGLVAGHAYSLIRVVSLELAEGGEARLVQMRNPWSHFEWNGEWSDKDERWTEELRVQVGCEDSDDGLFFITVSDLHKNFGNYYFNTPYRREEEQHARMILEHPLAEGVNATRPIFVRLTFGEDVDCSVSPLVAVASTQGPRWQRYRLFGSLEKFSQFPIAQLLIEEGSGEVLGVNHHLPSDYDLPQFMQVESGMLMAGKGYLLALDIDYAFCHRQTDVIALDHAFRHTLLDISCGASPPQITLVDETDGAMAISAAYQANSSANGGAYRNPYEGLALFKPDRLRYFHECLQSIGCLPQP